jgi:hypothetical protein
LLTLSNGKRFDNVSKEMPDDAASRFDFFANACRIGIGSFF